MAFFFFVFFCFILIIKYYTDLFIYVGIFMLFRCNYGHTSAHKSFVLTKTTASTKH